MVIVLAGTLFAAAGPQADHSHAAASIVPTLTPHVLETVVPSSPLPSGLPLPSTEPVTATLDPYAIVWDNGLITLPSTQTLTLPIDLLPKSLTHKPSPQPNFIVNNTRRVVPDSTQAPNRSVVKLEYTEPNGNSGICSGFLYDDNTVATAAHCVYNRNQYEPNLGSDGWMTNIKVTPGLNTANNQIIGSQPYSPCFSKGSTAPAAWVTNGDLRYDFGTIKLDCSIGSIVGVFRLNKITDNELSPKAYGTIIGYPGDKPNNPPTGIKGTEQWTDSGYTSSYDSYRVQYYIDMFPGDSGAPIFGILRTEHFKYSQSIH